MTGRRAWTRTLLGLAMTCLVGSGGLAADFDDLMRVALAARAAGNLAAAEAGFRAALAARPDDPTALLHLGLVEGFQGRHDEALVTVRRGLARAPGDFDLRLAQARILGWMRRDDEAKAGVDAVLADFPGNVEALTLQGRLALYRGDAGTAETAFAEALRRDPGNAEAAKGLSDARSAAAKTTGRLTLGYSHSDFSRNANRDWNEGEADAVFNIDDDTRLLGHFQVSQRYGLTDTYVRGGVERRLGPAVSVRLAVGATPSADFLARWTAEAGATVRLSEGTGIVGPTELLADVKQSDYASGDVRALDPGLRQYWFDGRAWILARWLNSFDAGAGNKRSAGWSLRADWRMLDGWRIFGGRAKAPETEQGVTVDTQSSFGGVVVDLTPSLDLTLSYTHDNRKNTYLRDVATASIGYRF